MASNKQPPASLPTLDKPIVGPGIPLVARPLDKRDFDRLVQVIDQWWEGPIASQVHPIFFYELGAHARVVEDAARHDSHPGHFVGFLLGFIAPPSPTTPPTGYVHLVGIDPAYRRRGVGRALYREFMQTCVAAGVHRLKAIATVGNEGSLRFHEALGFSAQEDANYAGPGRKRVVFTRAI